MSLLHECCACVPGLRCTAPPPAITCRCASSWWSLERPCSPPRTATCRQPQTSVRRWRRATPSAPSSSMVRMLVSLRSASDLSVWSRQTPPQLLFTPAEIRGQACKAVSAVHSWSYRPGGMLMPGVKRAFIVLVFYLKAVEILAIASPYCVVSMRDSVSDPASFPFPQECRRRWAS